MANILNQEYKQDIRNLYIRQVIKSCLTIFSLVFLIGASLFLPSLVFVLYEGNLVEQEKRDLIVVESKLLKQSSNGEIAHIRSMLEVFQDVKENETIGLLEFMFTTVPESVQVHSISVTSDQERGFVVQIKGVADSREAMISFAKVLEDTKKFPKVVIPYNQIVQNDSIPFNLELVTNIAQKVTKNQTVHTGGVLTSILNSAKK